MNHILCVVALVLAAATLQAPNFNSAHSTPRPPPKCPDANIYRGPPRPSSDTRISAGSLKVAAWNVQVLGQSKSEKPDVLLEIARVMRQYDVVAIQEVKDKETDNIQYVLKCVLNRDGNKDLEYTDDYYYDYTYTERVLGADKEQIVVFYRRKRVEVESIPGHDFFTYRGQLKFSYRPSIMQIKDKLHRVPTFTLVSLHVRPTKTWEEIPRLANLYDEIIKISGNDVMFAGDMNADNPQYLNVKDPRWIGTPQQRINFRKARFTWLIKDGVKTNVARGSDWTYDRIVVAGNNLPGWVVQNSAKAYYFDKVPGYNTNIEASKVSDHYPVEVELKPRSGTKRKRPSA